MFFRSCFGLCIVVALIWPGAWADICPAPIWIGMGHVDCRFEHRERFRSGAGDVAEAVASAALPTVHWAASRWVDVPGETFLEPLDLVCLGGVVMLAFHFAGQTARRPTVSQRATMRDFMRELGLAGKYPKLEKRDLIALVTKSETELYSVRQELKSIYGMPEEEVKLMQQKLQELCSDIRGVAIQPHVGGVFSSIDKDGDGMIEMEDFVAFFQKISNNELNEEEIQKLLSAADVNQDGRINFMEFVDFIFAGGTAQDTLANATTGDATSGSPPPLMRTSSGTRQRNADGTTTYVHRVSARRKR